MNHLITHHDSNDFEWAKEWIEWSSALVPGEQPPFGEGDRQREQWVDMIVDAFCRKYEFLGKLLSFKTEGNPA